MLLIYYLKLKKNFYKKTLLDDKYKDFKRLNVNECN